VTADRGARADGSGHDGSARGGGAGRRAVALVVLIIGLAGLAISLTGAVSQVLPRQFTASEQRRIEAWEVSRRWQDMPAGQIFPASVTYQLPARALDDTAPLELPALRVSIAAQQSDCAKAVTSAAAGAALTRNGCQAVLRATYVDATRSYVMTVGVAALPTEAAAAGADRGSSPPRLDDHNRQISASFTAGPYVIMYAAGYADGRPRVPIGRDLYASAEMISLARGVARSVADTLAAKPAVPRCPGAPGC